LSGLMNCLPLTPPAISFAQRLTASISFVAFSCSFAPAMSRTSAPPKAHPHLIIRLISK
jgi:hypothetical protein